MKILYIGDVMARPGVDTVRAVLPGVIEEYQPDLIIAQAENVNESGKSMSPDDMKELKGRVGEKEFKAADPDDDGTLDEAEFKALVAKLFKEANPDDDGTLDETELKSPAGQKLLDIIS